MHILNTLPQRLDPGATPTFAGLISASLTAPTTTDLTLTGGSTGASLVLGQGATADVTVAPTGSTSAVLVGTGVNTAKVYTRGTTSLAFGQDQSGVKVEWARLTNSTGNLLIGGTTDITGSGGLKIYGTTAASSTTTGALQVAGGVGVAGAGYFGGAVLSGAQYVITGNGSVPTASTIAVGTNGAGSRMLLNVPSAGEINFNVNGSLVSAISSTRSFYATQMIESVNSTPSTGAGTGALQVAGGIYAGAASVFGSNISVINGSASADLILSRPTTSLGSTVQYKTGATLNWYHGTRGLANNNWYLFNNNLSTNTLILDYATDAATFAGSVITPAATTAISSVRLPHGTAPTSPVNGDMWTTTAGLYVRINGVTVGPLS